MTLYFFDKKSVNSAKNNTDLVVCFCASWCNTCREYQPKLLELSNSLKQYVFYWVDIENHTEQFNQLEIDNFPTVLIRINKKIVFFGAIKSKIFYLNLLINHLQNNILHEINIPESLSFYKQFE